MRLRLSCVSQLSALIFSQEGLITLPSGTAHARFPPLGVQGLVAGCRCYSGLAFRTARSAERWQERPGS